MRKVIDLNEALSEHDLVVVEFTGVGCPACKAFKRILEELEPIYKDIFFCEVNVEESPEAAGQFCVMSIPATFLVADGMIVDQIIGAVEKDEIENKLLALRRMT